MSERLIDVLDEYGLVKHTYPVTVGRPEAPATNESYEAKALEAAAHSELASDEELRKFTAKSHASRSGPLQPYGDQLSSSSETKHGLEQAVRERAHFLWIEAGRPVGHDDDHWRQALEQHFRLRAYVLWRQEGCPEGRAEEHWSRVCEFQEH
ncbi:DUF2934 domain-containing protein [Roseomonas xinghualingensis]|uniref:DUF2934 domain-containing protein n=1 Tax=Roseomonas xinghualingensis TaxID=2986475 RepID=UPI0021F19DF4|nr:DUF2934 domain-containing protein [Roseomonas sp. SXEYE001]MCV4210211.1 DUF2934 domain-containing protein [Roseomonas sp. SXEYE001]